MSKSILMTRPREQAESFIQDLGTSQPVIYAPMIEIQALDFEPPEWKDYDGLIVTSANAVQAVNDIPNDIPVLAVGPQSAKKMEEKGFSNIVNTGGNVIDLMEHLDSNKKYMHIRGKNVAHEMPEFVEYLEVYDAVQTAQLQDDVRLGLARQVIDVVSFFSARSALNFARLIEANDLKNDLGSTKVLCISNDVVECVQAYSWNEVYVSEEPNRQGMVQAMREILE